MCAPLCKLANLERRWNISRLYHNGWNQLERFEAISLGKRLAAYNETTVTSERITKTAYPPRRFCWTENANRLFAAGGPIALVKLINVCDAPLTVPRRSGEGQAAVINKKMVPNGKKGISIEQIDKQIRRKSVYLHLPRTESTRPRSGRSPPRAILMSHSQVLYV